MSKIKNFLNGTKAYFKGMGRAIYDSKKKKIMHRTPLQFTYLCLFFIAYYIVLTAFFVLQYYIIYVSVNQPVNDLSKPAKSPSMDYILEARPSIFTYPSDVRIGPDVCPNRPASYQPVKEAYDTLFKAYRAFPSKCAVKFDEQHGQCVIDVDTMIPRECNSGDYSLNTNSPCYFIALNRMFNYNPKSVGDNSQVNIDYMRVECNQTVNNTFNVPLTVSPIGLLRNGLPFDGRNNLVPFVSIRPNRAIGGRVECILLAEGINYSQFSDLARAVGRLRIDLNTADDCRV